MRGLLARRAAQPVLLALLVWFSAAWFASDWANVNNGTRLFAALAIVEQGTATIDPYAPLTIDKARFGAHYYLDKAPGMTLLALPAVALAEAVTGERAINLPKKVQDPRFDALMRARLRAVTASVSAVLAALGALALWALARGLTGSPGAALFAALGHALGTPIWGWSTTIFGHAPVASLYLVALWAVWRGTAGAASARHAAIAGAALGLAVVIEYQAVLGGAVIGLWALARLRGRAGAARALLAAVAGGAAMAALLIGYNLFAFGTVFRLSYQGVEGFQGMRQGFFGIGVPRADVLAAITVGARRGLIWVAPVLLLGIVGLVRLAHGDKRALALAAGGVAFVVLLVNAGYFYWDGGASTGPRHAMPAVGMLALGLAPFWAALRTGLSKTLAAALLMLSAAINLAIAATRIDAPEAYAVPLLDPVWSDFTRGALTDYASQVLRWSPWIGLALYVAGAGLLLALLLIAARLERRENINATHGPADHA